MPKAIKNEKHETCGKGWCNQHIFEILPISKTARIKRKHKIRMCPILNMYLKLDLEIQKNSTNLFHSIIVIPNFTLLPSCLRRIK